MRRQWHVRNGREGATVLRRLKLSSSFSLTVLLLVFGLVAGYGGFGLVAYLHAADGSAAQAPGTGDHGNGPVITRGAGDSCVADTDFMRRNHMQVLLHQRDETVISGLRDQPYSLVGCVNCHAHPVAPTESSRQSGADTEVVAEAEAETETVAGGSHPAVEYQRIDAPGQFCSSCHEYAAVKIDCFTCHAAKPAPGAGLVATSGNAQATAVPRSEEAQ